MTKHHLEFLLQATYHPDRVLLARKMKKSLTDIYCLCSYHDLMRVEKINKYIARIYIISGIRSVEYLRNLTVRQVSEKILSSRIGKKVWIDTSIISQTIEQAKQLEIIVFSLDEYKFLGYTSTKNILGEQVISKGKNSFFIDYTLFITTILLLLVLSPISLYFLALIPIIVALHILCKSAFLIHSFDIFKNILSPKIVKQSIIKTSLIKTTIIVFSTIFLYGFFFGDIQANIQKSYHDILVFIQAEEQKNFFSDEIHENYKNKDISREELVVLLLVAKNISVDESEENNCFKDSFQSHFPREICYAYKHGYIQGDSLGNFNPKQAVSHAGGLKIILNFYQHGIPRNSLYLTYTDLQKNQWQTRYAEYAKRIGLISPTVKEFYPDRAISIDQVERYISHLEG